MAKARIKYQTLRITHLSGTTPSIVETRVALDNAYNRCTGIAVYPVKRTSPDNISLGFKDDNERYQDNTFITDNESSVNTSFKDRYKEFDIRANGNAFTVQSQIDITLTADYIFDVVFIKSLQLNCFPFIFSISRKYFKNLYFLNISLSWVILNI